MVDPIDPNLAFSPNARAICATCFERVESAVVLPEMRLSPCGHGGAMISHVEGRLLYVEPDGMVYDITPPDPSPADRQPNP